MYLYFSLRQSAATKVCWLKCKTWQSYNQQNRGSQNAKCSATCRVRNRRAEQNGWAQPKGQRQEKLGGSLQEHKALQTGMAESPHSECAQVKNWSLSLTANPLSRAAWWWRVQ